MRKTQEELNPKGKNRVTVELDLTTKPARIGLGADYSLWDSFFILLEGVAFVTNALIQSKAKTPKEVSEKINRQLGQAMMDYKYLGRKKE